MSLKNEAVRLFLAVLAIILTAMLTNPSGSDFQSENQTAQKDHIQKQIRKQTRVTEYKIKR